MEEEQAKKEMIVFPLPIMGRVGDGKELRYHETLKLFMDKKVCIRGTTPAKEPIFWFHPVSESREIVVGITLKKLTLDYKQQDFACPLLSQEPHSAPLKATLIKSPVLNKWAEMEVEIYAFLLGNPLFCVARKKGGEELFYLPSEYFDVR